MGMPQVSRWNWTVLRVTVEERRLSVAGKPLLCLPPPSPVTLACHFHLLAARRIEIALLALTIPGNNKSYGK